MKKVLWTVVVMVILMETGMYNKIRTVVINSAKTVSVKLTNWDKANYTASNFEAIKFASEQYDYYQVLINDMSAMDITSKDGISWNEACSERNKFRDILASFKANGANIK